MESSWKFYSLFVRYTKKRWYIFQFIKGGRENFENSQKGRRTKKVRNHSFRVSDFMSGHSVNDTKNWIFRLVLSFRLSYTSLKKTHRSRKSNLNNGNVFRCRWNSLILTLKYTHAFPSEIFGPFNYALKCWIKWLNFSSRYIFNFCRTNSPHPDVFSFYLNVPRLRSGPLEELAYFSPPFHVI